MQMRKISLVLAVIIILVSTLGLSGCASYDFAETGTVIITAKEAIALMGNSNTVFVDLRSPSDYEKQHVYNAVNVPRSAINIDNPFSNMLAPKEQIEEVMGQNGISNDTLVIAYDSSNNMDASRLWWTLMIYGHENTKVVSGGFKALVEADVRLSDLPPAIQPVTFIAKDLNESFMAYKSDVLNQVNDPDDSVVLVDTRSLQEYNMGTIPSSLHIDYLTNNYNDGTFKSIQDIQIMYLEKDIKPETTVIIYCLTSIRGAQTLAAMWNAGYRNLMLYDGAWTEWITDESAPSDMPGDIQAPVGPSQSDNS
jgi:thiosulfate/3-mercaptopyruvate sulfurtransferase